MKQYFRIVLLFFVLLYSGHLHARPVCHSLGIKYLKNLACKHNLTSPTNVEKPCQAAALKTFKQGLKDAQSNCNDTNFRIQDTLDALDYCSLKGWLPENSETNSTECSWSHEPFTAFIQNFEDFIHKVQTASTTAPTV